MRITLSEEEYKAFKLQEHVKIKQGLLPFNVKVDEWDFNAGWIYAKELYTNLEKRVV